MINKMKTCIHKNTGSVIACILMFAAVFCMSTFISHAQDADSGVATVATGTDKGLALQKVNANLIYKGKVAMPTSGTACLVKYQGVVMVPIKPMMYQNGAEIGFAQNSNTFRTRLTCRNNTIILYPGNNYMHVNGIKTALPCKIIRAKFTASGKTYTCAPLELMCKGLGITGKWNANKTEYSMVKKEPSFNGKKISTQYPYTLNQYAALQKRRVGRKTLKQYQAYVDVKKDTTHGFKYLRIDQYRSVDEAKYRQMYQFLIEDYCKQVGISTSKSSLYGKYKDMLAAAKKNRLDPVYLVCQTFLESAYGTSKLASGNWINKVAYKSYKRYRNGKFKTRKLKKKVKVYNLYGIHAYDADPFVGGTSHAYYKKWTTPRKALYGAGRYLKSNYAHSRYKQNTLFKMRYMPSKNPWHQYATAPDYAESIGQRMYMMSSVYSKNATFTYDYPKYK